MNAFSPRIRHALNFALKHHAGQTRKNRRAPYIMHPVQVALILARYDRPDDELVAAILHDVIEDCVATNAEQAQMTERIRAKFGDDVTEMVLGVTEPKRDASDVKLPGHVRRDAYLDRLGTAPLGSLWVCAGDKVQNGSELLCDLQDHGPSAWAPFSDGKDGTAAWYRRVHTRLRELGFDGGIMAELDDVANRLEEAASAGGTHTA